MYAIRSYYAWGPARSCSNKPSSPLCSKRKTQLIASAEPGGAGRIRKINADEYLGLSGPANQRILQIGRIGSRNPE